MIEPKTYRKKPVHVEAMKFDGATADTHAVMNWLENNEYPFLAGNALHPESLIYPDQETGDNSRPDKGIYIDPATGFLMIRTMEGDMTVRVGDWVIQGIKSEFYPCKPDIFAATYEQVDQDGNRVNSTQYPESTNTPVMTVAAVIEWLEGEKEDIEATRKSTETSYGALGTMTVNLQAETVQILIDNLAKSTFEQMDEAHGNE